MPARDPRTGASRRRRARRRGLLRLGVLLLALSALVTGALAAGRRGGASSAPPHAARTAPHPAPHPHPAAAARRPAPVRPRPVHAPVIAQRLHNDCEATALQILLASAGVHVDQLRLLRELPRSGPLDPRYEDGREIWGDPARGFVGRADGGGRAGGFGVYQGPVAAVARRHHRPIVDLTGSTPAALYARLRAGHAVMTWIALSFGPYGHWYSPAGRLVRANYGEHTIVLTGVGRGTVRLVNPLHGTRETWSRRAFEARWRALGRRALSTG